MEIPEHKEIRELARRFLSERGGELRAYEEEEAFPWPLVEGMAGLGFLGVFVPEELGGAGLDFFAYLALLEEMGGWASLRSILSVQQSLVLTPLLAYGTEAQKARYVPRLARGEVLGAFGLTEASPWRRGRWGSWGALWTSPWPMPGKGSSSAAPSPSSSWSRNTWPP